MSFQIVMSKELEGKIIIRKANVEDASLIANLGEQTFWESHGHSADKHHIENFISRAYSEENQKKELDDKANEVYIAYFNDQPVGFSKIVFNLPNELISNKPFTTKFDRIYVLKEYYDLKIGKLLFEYNVELAKRNNQTGMWLYVWVENKRAVRFYEKCGFKIIGSFDYVISPEHNNPNHILYLEF